MSAIGDAASGPGVGVDLWLAARYRRLVLDLGAALDFEAGVREAGWVREDRAGRADPRIGSGGWVM